MSCKSCPDHPKEIKIYLNMLNILGLRSILKGLTSAENSSVALSLVKQLQSMLQQNKALFSTIFSFSEIQCHKYILWKRRTGLLHSPRQEYFFLGKNMDVWRHLPSWTALWMQLMHLCLCIYIYGKTGKWTASASPSKRGSTKVILSLLRSGQMLSLGSESPYTVSGF